MLPQLLAPGSAGSQQQEASNHQPEAKQSLTNSDNNAMVENGNI
jgi:hypothetical protein